MRNNKSASEGAVMALVVLFLLLFYAYVFPLICYLPLHVTSITIRLNHFCWILAQF